MVLDKPLMDEPSPTPACRSLMSRAWDWLGGQVRKAPLTLMALIAFAGICTADDASQPAHWVLSAVVLLIGAGFGTRTAVLLLAVFSSFGATHALRSSQTMDHPLRVALRDDQRVWMEATGRFKGVLVEGSHSIQFEVHTMHIPSLGLRTDLPFHMEASFDSSLVAVPKRGGSYQLHGYFRLAQRPRNPSLYHPDERLLRQGMIGSYSIRQCRLVEADDWDLHLLWLRWASAARQWMARQITVSLEDSPEVCGLLQLTLLGSSTINTAEMEEAFRASGTMHIFSVSGLHVGLLALVLWGLLRMLRLPHRISLALVVILVLAYALITGWSASAARASIMATVMSLSLLAFRRPPLVNALGFAALFLLACDTQQAFQVGFQLSFLVVWTLCVLTPRLLSVIEPWVELDPYFPEALAPPHQQFMLWCRRKLAASTCTSIAAWIAGTPLTLVHFHTITPIALVANLVQVPLSFCSLVSAVVSLLFASCGLRSGQVLLNEANYAFAHTMLASAQAFASVPGGNTTWKLGRSLQYSELSANVLSVPHGQAALLIESKGKFWAIDCGTRGECHRTVLPCLRAWGSDSLQGLILTHADSAHGGGAPVLMERCEPPWLAMDAKEPSRYDTRRTALWQATLKAEELSIPIAKHSAGDSITLGSGTLTQLWPQPSTRRGAKADDRCSVYRLNHSTGSLLYLSDIGWKTERQMLDAALDLRSDVIVCGEHESSLPFTPALLRTIQPRLVIACGSASSHLKEMCNDLHLALMETAKEGMVSITFGTPMRASTWLTQREVALSHHSTVSAR
jgi:competence protein ComEC